MVAVLPFTGLFETNNGAIPCEGTKAIPFLLDFSAANAYLIDLTPQWQQKQFVTLQTIWIDNSQGNSPIEVLCSTINQLIYCPPRSQGYFALLQPMPPKLVVQSDNPLVQEIILLNFYIPPTVWAVPVVNDAGIPSVDIPALDPLITANGLNVNSGPQTIQGMVDASDVITVGGTAQIVVPANAARKRWIISNPSTATEILQFMFGDPAAGCIDLLPGATWDESNSEVVGDAVYVVATTINHAFTAYYK